MATSLPDILVKLGWVKSKREARRLINDGAIRINDQKIQANETIEIFVSLDKEGNTVLDFMGRG